MCYDELIGLEESCSPYVPTSGLYLEDLEGMSVETVSKWAGSAKSKNTAQKLFDKKAALAYRKLETRVSKELANQGYNTQTQNVAWPTCSLNNTYHNPTSIKRGLRVVKKQYSTPFSSIFVESIAVKTLTGGTVKVQVLDEAKGVLKTKTITGLQPKIASKVTVNWSFPDHDLIYIVTDSPNQEMASSDCKVPHTCCGGHHHSAYYSHPMLLVAGWAGKGDSINSNSFGIQAAVSLTCSLKNVMCELLKLEQFQLAALHMVGIELLSEQLASERINFITIHNTEEAEANRQRWDIEVNSLIQAGVSSAGPNLAERDRHCIECKPNPMTVSLV